MRRTSRLTIFAAVIAVLLLAAGSVPALAHGRLGHGGFAPVQGTVTLADNSRLQVSTANGIVTIALSTGTRVVRTVSGSTADLHVNQIVNLHIVSGTSTVDRIVIEDSVKAPGSRSGPPRHRDFLWTPLMSAADRVSSHTHGTPGGPPDRVEGQVVSATGSSITIRTRSGKATYTIGSSVVVTKLITGSLSDLYVGETVNVFRGRDGSAMTITIMSA